MNQSTLILVRHGQPEIQPDRPSREWRLSEDGRAGAAALAQELRAMAPSRMVASPEPKTEETAMIMAAPLGLSFAVDPGFVEQKRETAEFLSREAFEANIQALFDRPAERVFGEESADEAYSRFTTALTVHRMGGGNLVVVTHGTVISLWVSRRFDLAPMPFWKSLTLPCAVVIDGEAPPRLVKV